MSRGRIGVAELGGAIAILSDHLLTRPIARRRITAHQYFLTGTAGGAAADLVVVGQIIWV